MSGSRYGFHETAAATICDGVGLRDDPQPRMTDATGSETRDRHRQQRGKGRAGDAGRARKICDRAGELGGTHGDVELFGGVVGVGNVRWARSAGGVELVDGAGSRVVDDPLWVVAAARRDPRCVRRRTGGRS